MGITNKLRNENGRADIVTLTNLAWRVLQFAVGAIVLVMYATQPSYDQWDFVFGYNGIRWSLGIAAGAMAVITSPILATVPFFIGYQPIALACVWDFIMMAVYAGTFAYFKARFPYGTKGDDYQTVYHNDGKVSNDRINVMRAAVTIDLIGMLLWLITFLMAVGLLVFGRVRGGKPTY